MTAPSLLPKRGRGRQSAAAEAQYQKQVAAFCKLILQIRGPATDGFSSCRAEEHFPRFEDRSRRVLMSVGLIKDAAIKHACEMVSEEAGTPIGDEQVRDLLDRPKKRRRSS